MVQLLKEDIQTTEVLDWHGVHLIHFSGSSCSQKARIFLNLKGIDWQSHPLNLAAQENYKPWFLGINPRGLVPVLVHDGNVHIESNDILAYLDSTFASPPLIPDERREEIMHGLVEEDDLHLDLRALTMRFVFPKALAQKKDRLLDDYEANTGTIGGEEDAHKAIELRFWRNYANRGVTDEEAKDAAQKFHAKYAEFEKHLSSNDFLGSADLSLLDIAWFIYTHRLSEACYPFKRLHPNVHKWYENLANRREFIEEVRTPKALAVLVRALHTKQRLSGTTLSDIAGF